MHFIYESLNIRGGNDREIKKSKRFEIIIIYAAYIETKPESCMETLQYEKNLPL